MKKITRRHELVIGILSCVFGIASWIAVNGIWVEVPTLINDLPEGWTLASYLTVITQLANIGPLTYGVLKKTLFKHQVEQLQHVTIYAILGIGVTGCVCLACFWDYTCIVFGKERSLAFFMLVFTVALVDCTSSVTFLPFMSVLPQIFMSPFYIGENLSGLIPALVALSQGVERYDCLPQNETTTNASQLLFVRRDEMNFDNTTAVIDVKVLVRKLRIPREVFFMILAVLIFLSLLSYVLLNNLPFITSRLSCNTKYDRVDSMSASVGAEDLRSVSGDFHDNHVNQRDVVDDEQFIALRRSCMGVPYAHLKKFLVIMFCMNFLQNGVIAAIGSFTYAPYGDFTYHLAASLGPVAASFSCFMFMFYPYKSEVVIMSTFSAYLLTAIFVVVTAVQSPTPWFHALLSGKVLVVFVAIISSSLCAYTKLAIASVMRDYGHKSLFDTGIAIQCGCFCGAVLMFPIVNYTNVFQPV